MTGEKIIAELKGELMNYGLSALLGEVNLNKEETIPVIEEASKKECVVCHNATMTGRIVIPQPHLAKRTYRYICSDRNACRQRVCAVAEKHKDAAEQLLNALAKGVKLTKYSSD